MKNIEIATAHNIVFKYELASLLLRGIAFVADAIILFLFLIFGSMVIGSNLFSTVLLLMVFAFYHLLFEVFNRGQSPGKMMIKIRVVTLHGTTPKLNDYFIRWVFRLVDVFFTGGMLALINIAGSDKNQRVGDLIAQTSVVSLRNTQSVGLKSLVDLDKLEEKTKYPGLRQFNDEDMLLLKHAINRYQISKTPENKEILTKIGSKILEALDLNSKGNLKIQFLKELLNEYVIITR